MPALQELLVLGLLLALGACGGAQESEGPPPSIIVISLDTLRAGHMGLYGYERDTTPYLDRFAGECLVFEDAKTVAPWTLISHVTMLTGLYPDQHGVVKSDLALSTEIPFLAERLSDYGYRTFGYYKPGFVGVKHGHQRGFDVFESHELASEAQEHMAATLVGLGEEQPLFLFLHLFDIHAAPLVGKDPLYYRAPAPFPNHFQADAEERLAEVDFRRAREGKERLTDDQVEALVATYDGGVRYVDGVLEELIEGWRAQGLLDNSILIITADHGESLGQRYGRIKGHGKMFEEALHVPMIVRFPDGYRAGEREPGRVSMVDVVPTVLEAAGLEADARLPGISLREKPDPGRLIMASRPPTRVHYKGPWKVISIEGKHWTLFNLDEDPLELDARKHEERAQSLFDELTRAFDADWASRPAFDGPPIPAGEYEKQMREQLDALGYAGD